MTCQQIINSVRCLNKATNTDNDKMVYCDLHFQKNASPEMQAIAILEEKIKKLEDVSK